MPRKFWQLYYQQNFSQVGPFPPFPTMENPQSFLVFIIPSKNDCRPCAYDCRCWKASFPVWWLPQQRPVDKSFKLHVLQRTPIFCSGKEAMFPYTVAASGKQEYTCILFRSRCEFLNSTLFARCFCPVLHATFFWERGQQYVQLSLPNRMQSITLKGCPLSTARFFNHTALRNTTRNGGSKHTNSSAPPPSKQETFMSKSAAVS